MNTLTRLTLLGLFFLSGFSGLVYQVVWTRLAFASFGVIAPVLSIVLSVFMLGLAVGSWSGGRGVAWLVVKTGLSAIVFYGGAELIIGLGAFAVPVLFASSERMLAGAGQLNSFSYLFYSALALAISIFPWCFCMGTTFPFMMAYIQERESRNVDSFSFLYVANVLGAMTGTVLTAVVLVETIGFHRTLWVAAGGNFLIALISMYLAIKHAKGTIEPTHEASIPATAAITPDASDDRFITIVLFSTGFISMAMEVVWARGFVGVLKTQVYSFALIIFTYLLATFCGSMFYRKAMGRKWRFSRESIFLLMAIFSLLPIYLNDPRITVQKFGESKIDPGSAVLVLCSIFPLCAVLGYLTPSLIDEYSAGHPQRGGSAYAANVVGCIVGPLVACYLFLPHIGCRYSLILLGLSFTVFWLFASGRESYLHRFEAMIVLCLALSQALFRSTDFDEWISRHTANATVRHDYIASVASGGNNRHDKVLIVNGFGMTVLTPITKFIAHLPLALHQGPVKSVLVICFGMGTSYRSALTWGVDVTVVELVPSVPKAFGFYHADADNYASNVLGHIIIDDGRRYLSRCGRKFDAIVVDPPPPAEAAGSSLLFSTEFYTLARQHLNSNGILQMWYPTDTKITNQAVLRSMYESFPHVRCFGSIENWGMHMLGSVEPISVPSMDRILAKMPAAAQADLVEWDESKSAGDLLSTVLHREYNVSTLLNPDRTIQITDDRPLNEYYLLREMEYKAN